jgi:hypothetical protein
MEILKFSEPPKRSNRSGSARKNGLMPMVTFGIAVLVLGGMSTTLAGTITLNGSGGSVEFGQGVVTTAACDTSLTVTPSSTYDTGTATFAVNRVTIANIGAISGSDGAGCMGKYFKITAYDSRTVTQITSNSVARDFIVVKLPAAGVGGSSDTSTVSNGGVYSGQTSGVTISDVTGSWGNTQATSTAAGSVSLTGIRFSGTVEKITIESSDTDPTP